MPIAAPTAGSRILTTDLAAFYNLLKGVSGSGETITLVHNAGSITLQPTSNPAALTGALQIKNSAGTLQSELTYDGALGLGGSPTSTIKLEVYGTTAIRSGNSVVLRNNLNNANVTLANSGGSGAPILAIGAASGVTIDSTLTIGTTPSTVGTVRLPYGGAVRARNFNNTYDEVLIGSDSASGVDRIVIGADGGNLAPFYLAAAGFHGTTTASTTRGNGFPHAPTGAGVPTGAPTAVTGQVPFYYDTTNNRFYVYSGGTWRSVLLA